MVGKWWLLRAGGAGEPGEAAEGNGAAGKVHISPTRPKEWAKIDPLSTELVFELPAHFTEW